MANEASPARRLIHQACVIPYRESADEAEFCLITSLKKKRWIFPKGIIDPGETAAESGLKEAWEEAGLKGFIAGPPVGSYRDAKWGADLTIQVLMMSVTECEEEWPEADERQRLWLPFDDAIDRLHRAEIRIILSRANALLAGNAPDGRYSSPDDGSSSGGNGSGGD